MLLSTWNGNEGIDLLCRDECPCKSLKDGEIKSLPGLGAEHWVAAAPGPHQLGDLDIVLGPCEEAVHSPTQACNPCCVAVVLDIETYLGLVADAASSREDR